jgi:hypothetical protein
MNTIEYAKDKIRYLRTENLICSKTEQWHYSEDVFLCEYPNQVHPEEYDIKSSKDLIFRFEILDFAKEKNYLNFQQAILSHLIFKVFRNVALGSIGCEEGARHIKSLLFQLHNMQDIANICFCASDVIN